MALVYIATRFINIRLPREVRFGGLVHLGNTMLFIAKNRIYQKGARRGAFGMGLFDLLSEWAKMHLHL
ncbi:MAG: ECF transporter S component [Paeniclostridium sp.]